MPPGYSSRGVKTTLRHIKELEVDDRFNRWFQDEWIDLNRSQAIWVCYTLERAAQYIMLAGEIDLREPNQEELECVAEIDLSDSVLFFSDGDGGYLHVWPTRNPS